MTIVAPTYTELLAAARDLSFMLSQHDLCKVDQERKAKADAVISDADKFIKEAGRV